TTAAAPTSTAAPTTAAAPTAARTATATTAALAAATALAALALTGCGQDQDQAPSPAASPSQSAPEQPVDSDSAEVAAPAARLVLTYDGGLQVIDALTLELVADLPLDGFNRINPAGDERHAFVSTAGGFKLLDTGVYAAAHGDHSHYYAAAPILEDGIEIAAETPGHVVPHDDLTALFDDATGHVTVLEADDLEAGPVREYTAPAPHHGVAVALPDGALLVTQGTAEERRTVVALDAADAVTAQTDECPDVHGEGVAAEEAVAFGCQGGAVIYADGAFSFAAAPAPEGRISTIAGSEESAVLLGNYSLTGSDAPSTEVALIDTAAGAVKTVDIGVAYYSFTRGDDGSGLVLGVDGQLHVIDVEAGVETAVYSVIAPFELPAEWQTPRPRVLVVAGMVYVTDTAAQAIHAVDPATGEIWKSGSLTVTPNEIVGVSGEGAGEHDHDEEGEHDEESEHDE
ncbi:MAG: hypothetical protein LBG60_12755, partial [Bifidobacteriaceae bacterium]|nr:hypothetical protein [Bifidobacteriaceae bacterium]